LKIQDVKIIVPIFTVRKEDNMELQITPAQSVFTLDLSKIAQTGDSTQVEIQRAHGATQRELETMRADANKITTDSVNIRA
jgi:hypothetical protein